MRESVTLRDYVERLFVEQDERMKIKFDIVTQRFDATDKALKIAADLNARELEHLNNLRQDFEGQKGVLVSQELFDAKFHSFEARLEVADEAMDARVNLLERAIERAAGTTSGAGQAVVWVLSGVAGLGTLAGIIGVFAAVAR